jgi:hypothetical protein
MTHSSNGKYYMRDAHSRSACAGRNHTEPPGLERSRLPVREAARGGDLRQDGAPISSRSGRIGPASREGPGRRPLGLGGGSGNRGAEGTGCGWPASRRWGRRPLGLAGGAGSRGRRGLGGWRRRSAGDGSRACRRRG